MVLNIPCGKGTIRVYEAPQGYRAVWLLPKPNVWGSWAKSIAGALGILFGRMELRNELKNEERDAAWSEARKLGVDIPAISHTKPAISHKKPDIRQTRMYGHGSTVVFFKKHPFQGKLR